MKGSRYYRRILRLFPASFREEYGEEMERLYADRQREVEGRTGARTWLAASATIDVLVHATSEWGRVALHAAREILREGTSMDGWMKDLRFGVRGLLRRPGFTAAAVTTLALGIGATVAIFSVVNGVLLKPLPYPEPDQLVTFRNQDTRDGSLSDGFDHPDVRFWQSDIPDLQVAGYAGTRPTLTGMGDPEVIFGARVTNGLLAVFGLKPALGRDVTATEDVVGGPDVVMVSYDFWKERLGGSSDAIGRILQLNGNSWEIVGVAPEGFNFPDGARLWMPQHHDESDCGHGCNYMRVVGRLAKGASLEEVQQRMNGASTALAEAFPEEHSHFRVAFQRVLDVQVADVRVALWVLLGAVGMVLLIACANVANLLLVRSSERVGEMALRATLGAPRARIVRQLLTESLLLSVAGGALGLLLAAWGVSAMVHLAPDGIPRLAEAGVDLRVVGFAFLLVVAVTVVFGLAPALKLAKRPLGAALGTSRRTGGGKATGLSRSLLLSGEVALSLMLLLGAGLLFGTLRSIRSQDLGFATRHVERFRLSLPDMRYDTPEKDIRFFEELEERLDALPEVAAAGSAFGVPLGSGNITAVVSFPDKPPVAPTERPDVNVRVATVGYRSALSLPLVRGRWFTSSDRREDQAVAVINQAAARRFYGDEDPLGHPLDLSVSWGYDEEPARTIVGVVGDTRNRHATEADVPAVYVPNAQFGVENMHVTMRLTGAATALPAARAILNDMDPDLAVTSVTRMEDAVGEELAPTRFYLTLIGVFSVLAVILAAVGLYGVVAYSVSRRTREIGIRVALGAERGDVVGMALREGVRPAFLGVVVGIAGSLLGGRVLQSLLYGVEPQDPLTLLAVTAILLVVVFAATFLPARRASRIHPSEALRVE